MVVGVLTAIALVAPPLASAKKKKKAPAAPDAPPGGDVLKDAKLSKGDGGQWTLSNGSSSQRIVVAIRFKKSGASIPWIDAYSLEPGQAVAVLTGGATVSIVSATYN